MKKPKDNPNKHQHFTCAHAIPFRGGNLSNNGSPLLGRCPYKENMFLLNEFTNCTQYEKRAEEDA